MITDVKVTKVDSDSLKGMASVTLDDVFVITGLKVLNGQKGLFVAMPQREGKDKKFHDICFPKTKELRAEISSAVLTAYNEAGDELNNEETPSLMDM